MEHQLKRFLFSLFPACLALTLLWSCGGGAGGSGGTGQVSVGLSSSGSSTAALSSDASGAGPQVDAIFMTVDKVEVRLSATADDEEVTEEATIKENDNAQGDEDEGDDEESWVTVATPMQTFNLMDLQNCLLEKLGSAKLPAGEFVTQIRLVLGANATDGHPFANYVVIAGNAEEIKIPSGFESGLKIKTEEPAQVQQDGEVHITLVIDPARSLVFTGSGMILFKPVVRATVGGATADAFVSGKVTNAADGIAIAGATVTAATDTAVENSATTGIDGTYRFCVAPGTYAVTATADGFTPASVDVTVSGEDTVTADFQLNALPPQ